MLFSKSFGYAVRGVLYIAMMQNENRFVQAEEIASKLNAPRHFMGKVLKKLVKEKVLLSVKGPRGGFKLHENSLKIPVIRLMEMTDGAGELNKCVLRASECSSEHPCPLHFHLARIKNEWVATLSDTTLGELLYGNKNDFIKRISTSKGVSLIHSAQEKIF